MRKHAGTIRYKRLFQRMREAVSVHDPIGLFGLGAPEDEYDPEIGALLPRLRSVSCEAEVLDVVHQVFVSFFGEEVAGPRSAYEALAESAWQAWQEFRTEAPRGSR